MVVLQVTLSFVPKLESSWMIIWLLSVTAVVLTVTVVLAAAMTTDPAAAAAQTAGAAELEQFVAVEYRGAVTFPENVPDVVPGKVGLLGIDNTTAPVAADALI